MKYYIIAGEASGDLHGASLMKGLKEADPDAQFRVWGGECMISEGGSLVKHYKETAVMGFVEVVGSLKKILDNISLCKRDILEHKPELLILIDYPGFNFRIARFAKKHDIPVFFYISPTVWAWKEWRLKNLRRDIDRLFIIYPFEEEYFKKRGVEALYNGNPLLDSIAAHPCHKESREEFLQRNNLQEKPIVALLAGSRLMEINYLMPRMVKLANLFPDYQLLLAGAPSIERRVYERHLKRRGGEGIKLLTGETYSILKHAEVAIVASGTATLEAAIINTPQVVCYGGNELSYRIAKSLIKVKYISLVNLILDQPAIKELIQHDSTTKNMESEAKRLLSGKKRRDVLKSYAKLRRMLGGEGASLKVAQSMVREYKSIKSRLFYKIYESPIGRLKIACTESGISGVSYMDKAETGSLEDRHPLLLQAVTELEQYFAGSRRSFDVPLDLQGSAFQSRVWSALIDIPFGKTKSYGAIASGLGNKSAARAVGLACKNNPVLIMVPCHRVLGSHNELTGFNIGVEKKRYLLDHENQEILFKPLQ